MTKFEWERCNTCWTCKHRLVAERIFCNYSGQIKTLANRDILFSEDCIHREKEDWNHGREKK
jgi:hypothetical protein